MRPDAQESESAFFGQALQEQEDLRLVSFVKF